MERMSLRELELEVVFGVLELPPLPLVVDQRGPEVVPLRHPDQGSSALSTRQNCLAWLEEAERVGRRRGREDLVGEGDVQDTLERVGREP